jgi:hypothetical protein
MNLALSILISAIVKTLAKSSYFRSNVIEFTIKAMAKPSEQIARQIDIFVIIPARMDPSCSFLDEV